MCGTIFRTFETSETHVRIRIRPMLLDWMVTDEYNGSRRKLSTERSDIVWHLNLIPKGRQPEGEKSVMGIILSNGTGIIFYL